MIRHSMSLRTLCAAGAHAFSVLLALSIWLTAPALAVGPGDPAPAFVLPFIEGQGDLRCPECFAEAPVTVLVIWDRGCPHCLDLALGSSALADSIAPRGGRVLGIVLGPDDPESIKDLLWERAVTVRQLWDRERVAAGAYDLGIKHIGIFVIDRSGVIRARFDDRIDNLATAVTPAALEVIDRTSSGLSPSAASLPPINGFPASAANGTGRGWPAFRIDGRSRMMSTEGARSGDTGLYGETIENGALFLYRWDLRLTWELSPRIVIEPWLRMSDEGETVLTAGAEQLTNPHGSLSIRYNDRFASATLGAYPLRLSPLTLERWDLDDLPPIGGGSGGVSCGCGGGALGLQQKSLEILGPNYTFEGAVAAVRTSDWLARAWIAIPRFESSGLSYESVSSEEIRYRRIVYGGSVDLGHAGAVDATFGLPRPLGLRVGALWLEDDKRTLGLPGGYLPVERDERVGFVLGTLGPWQGVSADAEFAELRSNDPFDAHGRAFRGGLRGERRLDRLVLWGRAHRIQTDPGFDPYYRALTYEENREGWRGAFGARILPAHGAAREWLGLALFSRSTRERSSSISSGAGLSRWKTYGISLLVRPNSDFVAEANWVLLEESRSPMSGGNSRISGESLELRWEGLGSMEPALRIQAVRPDPDSREPITVWQTYCYVRILR
jgi:peroxiredoxin